MELPDLEALPIPRTQKALVLLDFQNDFVRPSGALYVKNTADFLDTLPQLAHAFRRVGHVFWVQTLYSSRRPTVDPDGEPLIVLSGADDEERRSRLPPDQLLDDNTRVDDEAFLSTDSPKCCIPNTPGAQFPAPILAAIDKDCDILVQKHDYSALDDELISNFRARLITEIYLCGSLCNVSVYATALSAASQAISVHMIEDCMGYIDTNRYHEAMRKMADELGVDGITPAELMEEIDWQETDEIAEDGGPRPLQSANPSGIEQVLDELDVRMSHDRNGEHTRSVGRRRHGENSVSLANAAPGQNADGEELTGAMRSRHESGSARRATNSQLENNASTRAYRATRNVPRVRRRDVQEYGNTQADPRAPEKEDRFDGNTAIRNSCEAALARQAARSLRGNQNAGPSDAGRNNTRSGQRDNRRKGKSGPRQDLRPGDMIGEGDSRIIYDLDLPTDAFEKIRDEVSWQKMYHMSGKVPRLVAVQGRPLEDGSIPIYRHPADESPVFHPYTSTVDQIRVIVERILGHPLNHVLIQLYRDGQDRISEHADKTLDIVRGSYICNVSLGSQRVMVLRTKSQGSDEDDSSRVMQRIPMPHESLFILGEKTNMRWLHGIRADKRPISERSREDMAYGGQRISLTFRHIGTFLDPNGTTIWGQGAISKTQDQAGIVIHGDPARTEEMIRAFGQENRSTEFDWDGVYGAGFDVVNFVTTETAQLILSGDPVSDLRVRLCLNESGHRYEATAGDEGYAGNETRHPVYIGAEGTKVTGVVNILNYLAQQPRGTRGPGADLLQGGESLPQIEELLTRWRESQNNDSAGEFEPLTEWESALNGRQYLGGSVFGIDDCSLWPVLRDIVQKKGPLPNRIYPNLHNYYQRVENRGNVKISLDEAARFMV
ncbi:isochorismatase family [Aspergillus sclerotialis]|uniref:Isochorismatase family n=1 Tax=Aspergillus sclerotialis TaxID=2070753 RepID=A0A3A2ZGD1_9EURO|nr:isochorismatase family [Aspergillus sclerotialis]